MKYSALSLQTASQQQLTVENQLTELKVQLDQATQRLENNTLTAPSKGIVHLNSEFEGKNRIPTGTEIAQIFPIITDTREVLITYYVSSDYLPLLDKGQTVRLKLEKIGNHGITIIGQLQSIDQTPTRTEQGNLFKLTALAKLSNEDSKLIQYGLQGRVTSVTAKKTYFDYFKDKILTHSD